jgi:hypothetical protein
MKHINNILLLIIAAIFINCSKDEGNQVNNANYPYEKFKVTLKGDFNETIEYDESKYVAAGGFLDPVYETYLELVPSSIQGSDMTIILWPPPGHPLENNTIGITIRSKDPAPWTFDRDYFPHQHNAILVADQYAIVNLWDDENSRDYVSRYSFQSSSAHVKLKREGDLLIGEVSGLKLVTFNGLKRTDIQSLTFQVRPGDNALID